MNIFGNEGVLVINKAFAEEPERLGVRGELGNKLGSSDEAVRH